jgi:hypothetical protein
LAFAIQAGVLAAAHRGGAAQADKTRFTKMAKEIENGQTVGQIAKTPPCPMRAVRD